jgi:hypothetical protein
MSSAKDEAERVSVKKSTTNPWVANDSHDLILPLPMTGFRQMTVFRRRICFLPWQA